MRNRAAHRFKSARWLSRQVNCSKSLECFGTAFSYSFSSKSVCLETVSPFEKLKLADLALQPDASKPKGSSWIPYESL